MWDHMSTARNCLLFKKQKNVVLIWCWQIIEIIEKYLHIFVWNQIKCVIKIWTLMNMDFCILMLCKLFSLLGILDIFKKMIRLSFIFQPWWLAQDQLHPHKERYCSTKACCSFWVKVMCKVCEWFLSSQIILHNVGMLLLFYIRLSALVSVTLCSGLHRLHHFPITPHCYILKIKTLSDNWCYNYELKTWK